MACIRVNIIAIRCRWRLGSIALSPIWVKVYTRVSACIERACTQKSNDVQLVKQRLSKLLRRGAVAAVSEVSPSILDTYGR